MKLDQATGPGQTGDGKGGQGQALQSNAIETTSGSNGSSGNNGDSGSSGVGASGKGKGSGTGGSGDGEWKGLPVDFENYWEAPEHLWRPREVSKRELEAVMVSLGRRVRTPPHESSHSRSRKPDFVLGLLRYPSLSSLSFGLAHLDPRQAG